MKNSSWSNWKYNKQQPTYGEWSTSVERCSTGPDCRTAHSTLNGATGRRGALTPPPHHIYRLNNVVAMATKKCSQLHEIIVVFRPVHYVTWIPLPLSVSIFIVRLRRNLFGQSYWTWPITVSTFLPIFVGSWFILDRIWALERTLKVSPGAKNIVVFKCF